MVNSQTSCGSQGVFYEGLAVVERDGQWFHALENGQPAYSQRYKMAEYFQGGLAWVQKYDGTWIRINKQGIEVEMRNTSSAK